MLYICPHVFRKLTPDPICLQSCYIFVNFCFLRRPQTPVASNNATYLSTCVSEIDPRPYLLASCYIFVNMSFGNGPQTPFACNHALHICQLVFLKKTPDHSCLQSCYVFVHMCVCVNVYCSEKMVRYRNIIWSFYHFSDPGLTSHSI
jgi:hypothetical protein